MPTQISFLGKTGDGEVDFTGTGLVFKCQVHVSAIGLNTRAMGSSVPQLYKGIGWWQLYEHKGELSVAPTGYVVMAPYWIQFVNEKWINTNNYPWNPSGADGFHWHLYSGVTADFYFDY